MSNNPNEKQQQTNATPVVVAPPPVHQEPELKYANVLYGLGITEVFLAILSFAMCIATLVIAGVMKTYTYTYFVSLGLTDTAQGIWCGAFLLASGILGIRAKQNPTRCIYNANIAMGCVSAFFMSVLFVMSVLSVMSCRPVSDTLATLILHALLGLLASFSGILNIIHLAFAAAGQCCQNSQVNGTMVYQQQQMVQLPNGQFVLASTQNYQPAPGTYQAAPAQVTPPPQAGGAV
ncbi:uncharacterized protein LOC120348157 [Styela clava]